MKRIEPLSWLFMFISLPLILLLTLPLIKMTFQPSVEMLIETIRDKDVVNAIARSISLSFVAGLLSFAMGTPLAYLLARKRIKGKIKNITSNGIFLNIYLQTQNFQFEAIWPRSYLRDHDLSIGKIVTFGFHPESVHTF